MSASGVRSLPRVSVATALAGWLSLSTLRVRESSPVRAYCCAVVTVDIKPR